MNAEKARAILAQAKADDVYEGPIHEDDERAIYEAQALVEQAQIAWDQYTRGPEVEAILRLANENFDGSAANSEPDTPQPEEAPSPQPETAPEPTVNGQEDDPDKEVDFTSVEPWLNYSRERVADIIAGVNAAVKAYNERDLTDLLAHVWAYEEAHKNRLTIITHLEDVAKRLQEGRELPDDPQDSQPDAPGFEQQAASEPEQEPEPVESAPAPEEEPEEAAPAPQPEPEKAAEIRQPPAAPDPTESGDYAELVQQVVEELRAERLHIPEPPQEQVPDLPWDWTRMSDKDLQRFYGFYASLAYYKSYLLEKDERMVAHCRRAADEIHNVLLVKADKYDDHGKQKTMTLLEAEIENDERVKVWRQRQRKHDAYAASHRRERDSLLRLCEQLSRLETMRHQEFERAGGKVGRSS